MKSLERWNFVHHFYQTRPRLLQLRKSPPFTSTCQSHGAFSTDQTPESNSWPSKETFLNEQESHGESAGSSIVNPTCHMPRSISRSPVQFLDYVDELRASTHLCRFKMTAAEYFADSAPSDPLGYEHLLLCFH